VKPVAVLILILIVVAVLFLARTIPAARDRLEEWLLRRRVYGLAVAALGALMYLSSENRYNRGLGVLLGFSGLIELLAFERSSAPSSLLTHRLHLLILSFPLAVAVWAIATLPPAALWSRLVYCAVAFFAPLIIFRETRRAVAGDTASFQKRAHDMEVQQAALEARPIGPNASQVRAFLAALNRLTPGQWETVMSRGELGIGAMRALEQAGRAEERSHAVAMLSNQLDGDYRRGSVASMAVEGLVVRDQMTERDLAALYAPFEPLIPIAALGGRAPSTPA
jgi:hypothetical protein